jgi:hypothetical protein
MAREGPRTNGLAAWLVLNSTRFDCALWSYRLITAAICAANASKALSRGALSCTTIQLR